MIIVLFNVWKTLKANPSTMIAATAPAKPKAIDAAPSRISPTPASSPVANCSIGLRRYSVSVAINTEPTRAPTPVTELRKPKAAVLCPRSSVTNPASSIMYGIPNIVVMNPRIISRRISVSCHTYPMPFLMSSITPPLRWKPKPPSSPLNETPRYRGTRSRKGIVNRYIAVCTK